MVALLESDQFDTSTGMASAIVKLVADVLSQRTTHGVAVGMPGGKPALAIGPCYSVRDARSIAKDAQEGGHGGTHSTAEWYGQHQGRTDA